MYMNIYINVNLFIVYLIYANAQLLLILYNCIFL